MKLTEAQVQEQCLMYLNIKHIYHWRQNSGSFKVDGRYIRSGIKGVADIIGILPDGRFLAVEVKRSDGGVVSQDQKEFKKNIESNHGLSLIVSSVEQLKQELTKAGY